MKSNKHCTILKIKCSFGFFSLANITYELGKFSFEFQFYQAMFEWNFF